MSDRQLQPHINIPIEISDQPLFDDALVNVKELFVSEMKRIDEEMAKFSANLMGIYSQTDTALTTSKEKPAKQVNWELLNTSPLIEGEGQDRVIKLRFDLSDFDPTEVNVNVINDLLEVTASHEISADNRTTVREYRREFRLPRGVEAERIVSSLTREGVLMVQAPFPEHSLAIK
ncbi:unnamed protein product [Colias eurytheme]|nr:unnamed protein product [Colias eurytheme]